MPGLEEQTIETLPDRCESCGAALTAEEKRVALDRGTTPVLCGTCAAEQAPVIEDTEDAEAQF